MDTEKTKKDRKKYLRNIVIMVFLVWLTFRVLFKDQNMDELFNILITADGRFVLLGICCMMGYYICESINLRRTLRELGENVRLIDCLKYTMIGFFYSSITPAATGGQPMQVYYMFKDGVKGANASLALVLNLFSFQVITISMAAISVCFYHSYLDKGLWILFAIGISLNSIALFLLIAGIFSKKLSTWIVKTSVKVIKKFKLKNEQYIIDLLTDALERYNGSAKYIRNNKKLIVRQFITTFVQEVVYYSIPFCIYKAYRLSGESYIKILCLQSIVYATVSGIPSPGSVGVSEGAFVSIFKTVFSEELINGAMLLNRGVSFYLFLIVCGMIVIVETFKSKKEKQKQIEAKNVEAIEEKEGAENLETEEASKIKSKDKVKILENKTENIQKNN